MQISDDLYLGPALGPNPGFGNDGNPAPMSQGVGPMGRIYLFDIVPLTAAANNIAAAQAIAGAANAVLTAGAGVTRITLPTGAFGYVLDVARCLTLVSSNAGDTTQTVTITGTDFYNAPMTARVTLNGTTPVLTLKAFKTVQIAAVSAVMAGNLTIGTSDRFGLPIRVTDAGYLARVGWAGVLAENAGTFVAAVTTDPATVLTGDVRGLYTPTTASNGANRLVVGILVPAIGSGPQATRAGAFGVTQV